MADYLNIAGRVRTTASDGVAMEAQEVKDLNQNKSQQQINADVQTELGDRYTKEETYSKEQLDELITTPDVNHVSVVATNATTAADIPTLINASGEGEQANTIYRVGNWNGTQYDPTMYALFAWNGTTYVCLAVRSFVGEVYDISVNHPDGQGNPTPYADLAAALGTSGANIPADIRRGGMSIKFIQGTAQSSDNKYVQYRLTANNWSITVSDWQGVDDEPTADSNNLVKSGGAYDFCIEKSVIDLYAISSSRPSGISAGEKYFNTVRNAIITVLGDGSSSYEETPVSKNGLFRHKDLYLQWDGTQLVPLKDFTLLDEGICKSCDGNKSLKLFKYFELNSSSDIIYNFSEKAGSWLTFNVSFDSVPNGLIRIYVHNTVTGNYVEIYEDTPSSNNISFEYKIPNEYVIDEIKIWSASTNPVLFTKLFVYLQNSDSIISTLNLLSLAMMEQGALSSSGVNVANNQYIRTKEFIKGSYYLSLPSDYIIHRIVYYNMDGTYNSKYDVDVSSQKIGKENCKCRLTIGYANGSNLSVGNFLTNSPIIPVIEDSLTSSKEKGISSNQVSLLSSLQNKLQNMQLDGYSAFLIKQFDIASGGSTEFVLERNVEPLKHLTFKLYFDKIVEQQISVKVKNPVTGNYREVYKAVPNDDEIEAYFFDNHEISSVKVISSANNPSLQIQLMAMIDDNIPMPMVEYDISDNMFDYSDELTGMRFTEEHYLEDVYAKFDALVSSYPQLISREDAAVVAGLEYPEYANGIETEGTYLVTPAYKTYCYKIIYNNTNINRYNTKKRKLLITSGLHGWEIAGSFNTYLLAANILKNCYADRFFTQIISEYDIYIIPCVNGYGIYHGTRVNANGVNINRNMPTNGWAVSGEGTGQYTGPSACSEFESKIIKHYIDTINPDVVIDHHNYAAGSKQFYTEAPTWKYCHVMYNALVQCCYAFIKYLPEYFGTEFRLFNDDSLAMPGYVTNIIGSVYEYGYEQGHVAATIEIGDNIRYTNTAGSSHTKFTADVFKVGEYTLRCELACLFNALNKGKL